MSKAERWEAKAMRIYQVWDQWEPGEFPGVLAIGDSWFWYPEFNLLHSLCNNRQLRDDYKIVQVLGFNGARLEEYIAPGRYAKDIAYHLSFANRHFFKVFLISGAGNDAVQYRLALKPDCSAIQQPAECFDPAGLDRLLANTSRAMRMLVQQIRATYPDEAPTDRPIFINGYDRPVPDGRGFQPHAHVTVTGPWLRPALDAARVTPDLQFRIDVIAFLINRLDAVFQQLHNPANGVTFIDSMGTLSTGGDYKRDWVNEIHPTASGFDRIVQSHWMPELRRAGMATA
jgi:hypothetical protein